MASASTSWIFWIQIHVTHNPPEVVHQLALHLLHAVDPFLERLDRLI